MSEPRITKQQYEQTTEAKALPYINALEEHNLPYTPDPGTERTRSDDQAILFDTSMEQFRNSNIQTRIHMDKKSFDDYFHRMLDYYETTESIFFDRCQNGEVTKKDFVIRLKRDLERMYPEICRYKTDQEMMIQRLYVAVFGYYVLQPLIDNPKTTDIKVCGPNDIRVRIKGKAYSSSEGFAGVRDLTMFVQGICIRNKIRYGKQPVVTFADSHDKNYILRFVISDPMVNAVPYPYLHIRKIPKTKPMFADLCTAEHNHMLTPQIADYLINRAKNARGVVFAGPPGSGKTTALNAFIEHIPKTRESLVIQENDELFTNQPGFMFKHVTHGYDGNRPYTLQDLGQMALVEGCNEFIIGEVKGGEMRNVMTLLNAGGYAALTVHSTNAYETMDKLADLVKYGSDYSFEEAHRMLSAMDTVIYMEGYKVRTILEIHGYNDQTHSYNYELVYKYDYDEEQKFLKMQEQARARNEPDPTDPFHSIMM